jgi:hypothetical protein
MSIIRLKDVVNYALELLNPSLPQERRQEILSHSKELLELLTLLENKTFIDNSQKFEFESYFIKDDPQ